MTVNPSSFKWQCGRCNHWNKIENGKCAQCGALSQQFATAFRLHNVLTAEELNFYKTTAPQILREVREVRVLLERMNKTKEEKQVEEERAKELLDQIWNMDANITKMMNENRGARMSKEKPVHNYDLIVKMNQEKEKLIAERRDLIIGQSTTQQVNDKAEAPTFTVTESAGEQKVPGVSEGVPGTDKVSEVLGKEEVPQQDAPKDGEPFSASEQIAAQIAAGKINKVLQGQGHSPNIVSFVRPKDSPSKEVTTEEFVEEFKELKVPPEAEAKIRSATKGRVSKAAGRKELVEQFIKLLEMTEKYFKQ